MATADTFAPRSPLVYRLPILGAIARELAEGDADFPLYLILALVSAWGCAIVLWGLPALALPAVALAPMILVLLVAITRG
ncbi:MAG: hypothetical protein KDK01_03305 [Rhodobacteraceae bacterium]|jgi:hypothetical protein|nr:hypothetical protein [Paracoccaceae bacterium]